MSSRLFGLARQISEYVRNRFMPRYRDLDAEQERRASGRLGQHSRRRGLPDRLPEILNRRRNERQGADSDAPQEGAPPVQPGATSRPGRVDWQPPPSQPPQSPLRPGYSPPIDPPSPPGNTPGAGGEDEFDDIEILGRDAGYDEEDFAAVMTNLRRTPGSSNVYGYFFEREARRTGILYVTFLQTGLNGERINAPGPTYAYYDVSVVKAVAFERAAPASAGGAVWDYLRVRGSTYGHQHHYRLVHVSGEYVPRKATRAGWMARAVPALGVGRRTFRRNTLSPFRFPNARPDRGEPDRGEPDRGFPDRGEPDRG